MSAAVFEPITLRGLTVRNRLWVPPMCQYMAEAQDGVATDWHTVHYGSLARGGAGAIVVEATGVVPEGRISPEDLGLWNDAQRDALSQVATFVHAQGAALGIQLAHAGRKASVEREWGTANPGQSLPVDQGGWETAGPSDVAYPGLTAPVAMDEKGIDAVVEAFAEAGRRAVEAGLDFIELHAAHGYLIHEFLSPLSNRRQDAYGGSLENRARFLLRVVDAVRAVVPETMPLVARLSASEWTDGGFDLDETAQVVTWLKERGVDLASISTSGNVPARIPVGPGYQTPHATAVKQATGIPVAAVGMLDEPWQIEQVVATGLADIALVGREFLRDPSFAIRAARELGAVAPVPGPYERAYRQTHGRR
ncbi:NADH:flavin oxidoreductase/NADH oxidase [Corynebacterium sp. AOP40-9SA-29]|uniref:NADH:flavin oxidoreductase/NADH oxidase n=1 Tax=Corynebacterium sp. AOP40-9SA-29 TaxID=3457677 RepID=UPI004034295E